ncbi:MAG: hypothetical protein C0483_19005 [Pirellula sp.]|nr:hypothetical protein [Pirellula sp.]
MPEIGIVSNVLRLQKRLESGSSPISVPGVSVRTFNGPDDVDHWLALRSAAFAEFDAGGRPWTAADFHREFLGKPWWSAERLWFAEFDATEALAPGEPPGAIDAAPRIVVGTITLARSGRPPHDHASVAWLMVAPAFRKRGIARALLATLETSAWKGGERLLTLETHASWTAAVRLYESAGYVRT